MANIYQFAITGGLNILNYVKSAATTVRIGGTPLTSTASGTVITNGVLTVASNALTGLRGNLVTLLSGGVTIKAETYREVAASDISKNMIITSDGNKKWITDNAVPQPRIWDISGYIMADVLLEPSAMLGFTLNGKKGMLLSYRNSRQPVYMKTVDNALVLVLIANLQFTYLAEASNGIGVAMTVQEVPMLSTLTAADDITSNAQTGSASGDYASAGNASVT